MPTNPLQPSPGTVTDVGTAELVDAVAQGRGNLRVVTADGRAVPLAYEPDGNAELPWAEYDPDTGTVRRRHPTAAVALVRVVDDTAVIPGHTAERSVIKRLAAAGVECARVKEGRDLTFGLVEFADGGHVIWSGSDRHGAEVSNLHPIAEHGSFGGQWHPEVDDDEEESFDFDTGNYAVDSAALVAHLIGLADRHGRAPAPIV